MEKPTASKLIELLPKQKQAQRSRAIGIAVACALFALMLYAGSLAKLITP